MTSSIPKTNFLKGLELCEKNANRLFEKMHEASNDGHYLCAFYLGTIALEEYGKALLILENWDRKEISEIKWKKEFTRHLTKMRTILLSSKKERIHHDKTVGVVVDNGQEMDESFLKSIVDLRDACRYVDFNFEEGEWESPLAFDSELKSWTRKIAVLLWWANHALRVEKQNRGL